MYEQQARIRFELDRAQARLSQLRAGVQIANETAQTAETEVARLHGLLVDLESRHKMQVGGRGLCGRWPVHCTGVVGV